MYQSAATIFSPDHLDDAHRDLIFSLWNEEYPVQLGYSVIDELDVYLESLSDPKHYFASVGNSLVGWAFCFTREQEMWFAVIIASGHHGKNIGTSLLNALKSDFVELNGWVADHNRYMKASGVPYPSPLAFYQKNGFDILHGTRLEISRLSAVKIQWRRG